MAQSWPSKAPTEIVERRWTVPVDPDDGLSSFTRSASGVTIVSYSTEGDDAVLKLSAGTDGATATVTLTATTSRGRVLVETFYLPIQVSTNAFAYTVRDVCAFALRKIAGNGADPSSDELADALERLNDMLASWKRQGADVGVALPLEASDTLYCPDEFFPAIKFGLLVSVHNHYGEPITAFDVTEARRGLQLVKSRRLDPATRSSAYY